MKKPTVLVLAGLWLTGSVFGGVVRKSKSEITFQKFGTFTFTQEERMTDERRSADMESVFKGKGIISSLAGKALLRSGTFGEIVDLPQSTVTSIDHKKKQYEVRPIQPMSRPTGRQGSGGKAAEDKTEESEIKIIRSEFTVKKTDETRTINQFACTKYLITWILEWENTKTGAKGTDRLTTDVWTAAMTSELNQSLKTHYGFYQAYMKKLGVDRDAAANDYLGLSWIEVLSSLDVQGNKPKLSGEKAAAELKKIEGFPIVIDGKYFSKTEGGPQAEEEESGGILGRLSKKVLDRKPKDEGETPVLAYYTEIQDIRTAELGPDVFQPPAGYKEKK